MHERLAHLISLRPTLLPSDRRVLAEIRYQARTVRTTGLLVEILGPQSQPAHDAAIERLLSLHAEIQARGYAVRPLQRSNAYRRRGVYHWPAGAPRLGLRPRPRPVPPGRALTPAGPRATLQRGGAPSA